MLTRSQTHDLSLCTLFTYCRQISGHWDEGAWRGAIRLGNGKPWATHFYVCGPGVRSGQESSDNGSEVLSALSSCRTRSARCSKFNPSSATHACAEPRRKFAAMEVANATHADVKWTIIAEKQDI